MIVLYTIFLLIAVFLAAAYIFMETVNTVNKYINYRLAVSLREKFDLVARERDNIARDRGGEEAENSIGREIAEDLIAKYGDGVKAQRRFKRALRIMKLESIIDFEVTNSVFGELAFQGDVDVERTKEVIHEMKHELSDPSDDSILLRAFSARIESHEARNILRRCRNYLFRKRLTHALLHNRLTLLDRVEEFDRKLEFTD